MRSALPSWRCGTGGRAVVLAYHASCPSRPGCPCPDYQGFSGYYLLKVHPPARVNNTCMQQQSSQLRSTPYPPDHPAGGGEGQCHKGRWAGTTGGQVHSAKGKERHKSGSSGCKTSVPTKVAGEQIEPAVQTSSYKAVGRQLCTEPSCCKHIQRAGWQAASCHTEPAAAQTSKDVTPSRHGAQTASCRSEPAAAPRNEDVTPSRRLTATSARCRRCRLRR